jgi:hypothetical protein
VDPAGAASIKISSPGHPTIGDKNQKLHAKQMDCMIHSAFP